MLVFDVNDFDEAYVGPFTWDLKRLAASLALLGYQKALSDDEIRQMIEAIAAQLRRRRWRSSPASEHDRDFALTLANTDGELLEVLRRPG